MKKTPQKNIMGSRVVEGFQCKPIKEDRDLLRPIMSYRFHLFFCDGGRCLTVVKNWDATALRELLEEMNLHRGTNRVKITRSNCFGACRFKSVVSLYSFAGDFLPLWLQKTHHWKKEDWKSFFQQLTENPQEVKRKFSRHLVPMETQGETDAQKTENLDK